VTDQDPDLLKIRDTGKFCPVHRDLVNTLGAMNRKLNLLILGAAVLCALLFGRDVLFSVIGKMGG